MKVTPEGVVKVLDFGLAKAYADDPTESVSGTAPTLTMTPTMPGVIMGTAAYMSPEQARSKKVDKRADIWAFGCVLYELITGKQAFPGETLAEIIAAVLKGEPDWQSLPAATPMQVRDLLRRCLQKDKAHRLRDAGDARIEIQEALSAPATASSANVSRIAGWRGAAVMSVAALLVAAIASLATWYLKPVSSPAMQSAARVVVPLPPGQRLANLNAGHSVALSPDGSRLVYIATATQGGQAQLYLRPMDVMEAKPIAGTDGAGTPFFSPDGQWIGFSALGKLKKVPVNGGSVLTLCDAVAVHGGSWTPEGMIVFADSLGLRRVPANGGAPDVVAPLDRAKGEITYAWPQVLSEAKAILFTVWTGPGFDEAHIVLQSLDTGQRRTLLQGASGGGYYVPSGHLVYVQAERLMAVPFDLARVEVAASPPVLLGELVREDDGAHLVFSGEGSLAYIPGPGGIYSETRLVWVDRKGKIEPLAAPPGPYGWPRLSPDGQQVAFDVNGPQVDVWLYNLARGTSSRLTSEAGSSQRPIWTPDGKRVTYLANRAGFRNLFWRAADGTGSEEQLVKGDNRQSPASWSPDGKVLAFTESNPTTGNDIWMLPFEGERKPLPFIRTAFNEGAARFSRDGRWLAYSSTESGRSEIYVQPYPGPGAKLQISTEGGDGPVWPRNGRELFYRNGNKMMAVEIATQPSFSAGTPSMLFEISATSGQYDVSSDGQRFLMVQQNEQATSATQINVVLNWFEELKRRVPAQK